MPSTLSDFEVMYTIGSGSYGTCKKVRRKSDGKIFVWKEMEYGSMTETEKQMLVSEVNLLRELKHDNIVKYHERVVDKKRQILYLIMEYCEGGDLAAVIKRYSRDGRHFDEETVWKTLAQCASALNECHKRKDGKSILHRDLKPANIFLDSQKNVKLGDFGLARVLHETSFAKTFVGTPYYMSPEQMNKLSYNEKSDIWSLGCVLYEMCTLRPPFLATNQRELAMKIRMGQFSRLPSRYSSELSKLLDKMLSVECNSRPSIDALMAHPQVMRHQPATSSEERTSPSESSGSNRSSSDLSKRLAEITQREARCDKREADLKQRETEIKRKEVRLQTQERELERRLARLEEREQECNSNERVYKGMLRDMDINRIKKENEDSEDADEYPVRPITPILCRAKKPIDSPSKHVSFSVEKEKENDMASVKSKMDILRERESNLYALRERERNSQEYQRRRELRERLEKAKQRASALRAVEIESRIRSSNLLNMR